MAFKIGFAAESAENNPSETTCISPIETAQPRKSVVEIYFAHDT